ncbi:MAG: hypothetical protein JO186_06910 [Actinobacteria bacterium]|nr:hypothetical protein [Actinomycetota bacterium]
MEAETPTATAWQARARHRVGALFGLLVRLELPVLALWIGAGVGLAALTRRVVDWFVMTDELLYERLAISVARLHSPLPHVHGTLVPNVSQLYPLLLATVFRHGLVPQSLHAAHVLDAYVMTSAAVPAFLLARAVTERRWTAYLVALLTATVPWLVFASFLLTEVVAYPAFLWAMLAVHHGVASPRRRNDLLALVGIAVATFARTEFFVLAGVYAVSIVLHERSLREAVARHRLFAALVAVGAVAAVVLAALGRFSSTFGTYSHAVEGNPFPAHFFPFFFEHLATIAFALGVLPFLVGVAWLCAGLRERSAFAAVAVVTLVVLTVEVTSFDLRFGSGVVRERYLFYVAPLVFVGFACALADRRWPRWSLLIPVVAVAYGFSQAAFPVYDKLNADTPAASLDNELLAIAHSRHYAHLAMAAGTVVLAAVFVELTFLLRRRHLAALLALVLVFLLPAETGYAFARLFRVDGTAGRPLTLDQSVVYDWVDRTVGTRASVTMVPYPNVTADYWAGVSYWWDLEFWNESVDHAAYLPGEFLWTPSTFPKLFLHFDPRTGYANASPSPYVIESEAETRFRISGPPVQTPHDTRGNLFIVARAPWRADWLTFGLSDDGWTLPGRAGVVRIFAAPGQRHPALRVLTLGIQAPAHVDARPFRISSGKTALHGVANQGDRVIEVIRVCVPAHGFGDVRITTSQDSNAFYGDPANAVVAGKPRDVGVHLTEIALADEIGGRCTAH